jgi:hypothetical protein
MSEDQAARGIDEDLKKIAKVGRGKRDVILIAALVVVAVLIAVVWFGFRGSHVSQGAAALTVPGEPAVPKNVPRATTP